MDVVATWRIQSVMSQWVQLERLKGSYITPIRTLTNFLLANQHIFLIQQCTTDDQLGLYECSITKI